MKRHRFAERRKARGLSQESLAEAVQVETSTVARWERGLTNPLPIYRPRLAEALNVPVEEIAELLDSTTVPADQPETVTVPTESLPPAKQPDQRDDVAEELRERLINAAAVDAGAIALLAAQTDTIREVDRRLGARAAEMQMHGHLAALDLLCCFTVTADQREPLANLYADASALAGWQCLDLCDLRAAWKRHEAARSAGRESRSPAALAHCMAQQAYVLMDLGELRSAVQLAEYARSVAGTAAPPLLSSWLLAVQGELYAVLGDDTACRRAFDTAADLLPADARDSQLPYIVLSDLHLARWRGNALARLGDAAAIEDLQLALAGLDASFNRARAGLHVDLAYALAAADQRAEAAQELREARLLATQVGSARQRMRISQLESVLSTA